MGSELAEMRPYSETSDRYYTPKERLQPLQRVEAIGLTYTYPGSGRGIQGVDLCLERGSFTVVAGASGAGKTTLLRVLLGQFPLEAGQIRWDGALIVDPGRFFAPSRATYIAQARIESPQVLYGGAARALTGGAELLVVDDLSAALDAQEERMLWDALFVRRLFRRHGTCLAVSNRQPALSRADQTIVLAEGRVVGEGRLEELLQTCVEMRRIWKQIR